MNLARLLWMGFGLITAWAIMTIPFAGLGLQYLGAPRVVIAVSLVVGLIVLLVAVTAARPIARYGAIVADAIERVPRRWFLLAVLVGGIFLRVLWIGYFPAPLQSDSAVYVALARGLIENGIYVDRLGQRGYWPPGYPFLLYACFLILGVHAWVPIAVNVILYAAAVYIVYRLGQMVACERVGRFAALLLTLWPNYIFMSGYPTKESFAILLIPLALLLYVSAAAPGVSSGKARWLPFFAGNTLGLASLVQPGAILLPGVFVIDALLRKSRWSGSAARLIAVAIGMLVVIAPWTLRNYAIFHELVPIATNGGESFYRANNPWATGSYASRGERSLEQYGELESNNIGYRWGKEWILSHPTDFLYLAVKKQIFFLGNDVFGSFLTFTQLLGICGSVCRAAEAVTNLYWLAIWYLIFVSWKVKTALFRTPGVLLLALSFMYFLAIHSVYESGTRHHAQLMGILVILASVIAHRGAASGSAAFQFRERVT